MSKVTSYVQKENEIRAWIAYGMNLLGMRTQAEMAKRLNMPPSTFSYRYRHPQTFNLGELWELEKLIGSYEGVPK